MSLDKEIKTHGASVKTTSYSMSVGELSSMYKDKELDLHPEFQRFFRWTDEQKSRFIESLLLGIPVPPIFVSEKESSKWDVIDGLQRLSTIFELMGELRDVEEKPMKQLVLTRTHYLPSLDGCSWESSTKGKTLPDSVKIGIKRARIDVNIVKSSSDEDVKYEIFQRLNTGGSKATEQEVRNCVLLMTDKSYFDWLKELSQYQSFQDCLTLSERAYEEAFDMELVTRFVAFVSITAVQIEKLDELGAFLTSITRLQAKDSKFPREKISEVFKQVFDYLSKSFGENSFRRFDKKRDKYVGALLVSLFEVIAVGLGSSLIAKKKPPQADKFKDAHKNLWDKLGKQSFTSTGVRASTRIPKTLEFGRKLFE